MKIFLCHTSRDKPLLREVRRWLPRPVQVWLDEEKLLIGEDIKVSIKDAITLTSDFVVVFIAHDTLNSGWVKKELTWAFEREDELGRTFVLPVLLDKQAWGQLKPNIQGRKYLLLNDFSENSVRNLAEGLRDELFAWVCRDIVDTGTDCNIRGNKKIGKELKLSFHQICWLSYDPLDYDPLRKPNPSEESIRRDLRWIRKAGFTGVVTYGCRGTLAFIPRIAKENDLAVIMGVWDITDISEIDIATAQAEYVDGYCAGHNGLNRRYSMTELIVAISTLRSRVGRPVTTTEEFRFYGGNPKLIEIGDWIFPDVHFSFRDTFTGTEKVDLDRDIHRTMEVIFEIATKAVASGCSLICKMILYPTKGAEGASLNMQRRFFIRLYEAIQSPQFQLSIRVPFIFHSAFDSPWKSGGAFFEWDQHTGLLNDDGSSRGAAQEIVSRFGSLVR